MTAETTSHLHLTLPDGSCSCGNHPAQPTRFAHLHQHTEYSLLDGGAKIAELVAWAKDNTPEGQAPALAMTDHGNMHGAIHFYNTCHKMGVKPILGFEAYVVPGEGTHKERRPGGDGEKSSFHLTLLARDFEGYQNLCRLSSIGQTDGFYGKPRIDHGLLRQYSGGVIASTGCLGSEINQLLTAGREDEAFERVKLYQSIFGENYFVEIQNHGLPEQQRNNPILREFASRLGIAMAATNDGHYVKQDDARPHEVLLAIQTKAVMSKEERFKFPCDEFYVKPLEEMVAALPLEEWGAEIFDNAAGIADMCNVELPVGNKRVYQLPELPIPEGRTINEEIRLQSYAGLVERYEEITPELWREYFEAAWTALPEATRARVRRRLGADPEALSTEEVYAAIAYIGSEQEQLAKENGQKAPDHPAFDHFKGSERAETILRRVEYELGIINNMGFADYFLIVADYIQWAKSKGISVGPGRGSGAGSIVAYALTITNIDPLAHGLIFERFLNPDRVSMPDFDVDFNDARRHEVIEYVQEKYGEDRVAQISTFGRMSSKSCFKDVARAYEVPYATVESVTKLIPVVQGRSVTLEAARREVADLNRLIASDPALQKVYDTAQRLEGLARHASVHAAGVVVAKNKLTDLVPLMRDRKGSGLVCQYDMKSVEDIGLIKMDFLGLRTLSFLDEAKRLLEEQGLAVDFDDIPLDDAKTYELLGSGDTNGVFQIEGSGITEAARNLKPRTFADIVALISLYRPGPMDQIPVYVRRHHGEEPVEYKTMPNLAARLAPILEETYGIIVYQEQNMQIATAVAGYSLSESDNLRRVMGKKDRAAMDALRETFVPRTMEHSGVSKKEAEALFDLLAKFAEYGFNKSHSAAYGVLTYQTAWLKANHPVEFMAALLSVESGSNEKVAQYMSNATKKGIEVLPPDINRSHGKFTVDNKKIYFGFNAIKGISDETARAIIDEREKGGLFTSLADFAKRLGGKVAGKKTLESLVYAGAFDALGTRSAHSAAIEEILEWAKGLAKNQNSGMVSLFVMDEVVKEPPLPDVPEFSAIHRLEKEKEALGFYISGHPLDEHPSIRDAVHIELANLEAWFVQMGQKRARAVLAGVVSDIKHIQSRQGNSRTSFMLSDASGRVDLVAFGEDNPIRQQLQEGAVGALVVSLSYRNGGELSVVAEAFLPPEALTSVAKRVLLEVDADAFDDESAAMLEALVKSHDGPLPLLLRLRHAAGVIGEYTLVHRVSEAFRSAIEAAFGERGVAASLVLDRNALLSKAPPPKGNFRARRGS